MIGAGITMLLSGLAMLHVKFSYLNAKKQRVAAIVREESEIPENLDEMKIEQRYENGKKITEWTGTLEETYEVLHDDHNTSLTFNKGDGVGVPGKLGKLLSKSW